MPSQKKKENDTKKKMIKKHVGSRKVKEKIVGCWTEEDLRSAIDELKTIPNAKIRGVAKKYGIYHSMET